MSDRIVPALMTVLVFVALGIYLGLQLFFTESEESGITKGLGIIEGKAEYFSRHLHKKVAPHVGWN